MSKELKILAAFLWVAFIGCLVVILILSFQDGGDAKELGKGTIYSFAQHYYGVEDVPEDVLIIFTYKFRQIGRILIFCLLAILGTCTIHLTFHNWLWVVRATISGSILMFIAVFTEEYKNFLPTRHFSKEEMLYSIGGVLIGFIYISTITGVYAYTKWSLTTKKKKHRR